MDNKWMLVIDNYENISQKAVNMLSAVISGYLKSVLPVKLIDDIREEDIRKNHLIVTGTVDTNDLLAKYEYHGLIDVPRQSEGYSLYVGGNPLIPDKQLIAIAGYDEPGLLYGCMDFCNKYCGDVLYQNGDIWAGTFFDNPFGKTLNEWKISAVPAVKTRGIWTWGHVIYDYRKFFHNMARLRLNEIVIWNDRMPLNAHDVVDYAHSLGIKVIWGFAWGWDTACAEVLEQYNAQTLQDMKQKVLQTYEQEIAVTGGDGIYFQSFTELHTDSVGGKCIAQLVTELVNEIAGELLDRYPSLHIQFGLHATSVKTHLDILKTVDPRVHILWEDCGAFPYNYYADNISGFDQTMALTRDLLSLRGEDERFGAVLKGMLKLDWNTFEAFSDPYILGERTDRFLKERQIAKNKIWKLVQADWLKNAEYARKIIALIAKNGKEPRVQALVEDAMFENEIIFPVALYAEMLWDPEVDPSVLIGQVAKYPCVSFG